MPLRSRLWNHGPRASTRRRISSFGSMLMAFTVSYLLPCDIMESPAAGPAERNAGAGPALAALVGRLAEQRNGFPVAVQCSDIDVGLAGLDAGRLAAGSQIGIDERADIFVAA